MKTNKIVFWVTTGLLSAFLLMAAIYMYIINHDTMAAPTFEKLGFPTWLIYPMAIAKISAVVAITTRKNSKITEWAYAGLFFNILLAIGAHIAVADGEYLPAGVALVLLGLSYYFGGKLEKGE